MAVLSDVVGLCKTGVHDLYQHVPTFEKSVIDNIIEKKDHLALFEIRFIEDLRTHRHLLCLSWNGSLICGTAGHCCFACYFEGDRDETNITDGDRDRDRGCDRERDRDRDRGCDRERDRDRALVTTLVRRDDDFRRFRAPLHLPVMELRRFPSLQPRVRIRSISISAS